MILPILLDLSQLVRDSGVHDRGELMSMESLDKARRITVRAQWLAKSLKSENLCGWLLVQSKVGM